MILLAGLTVDFSSLIANCLQSLLFPYESHHNIVSNEHYTYLAFSKALSSEILNETEAGNFIRVVDNNWLCQCVARVGVDVWEQEQEPDSDF